MADTFGGEVRTPTFTKLANDGLHYNAFHTTAICSPTRAAILTGRNHTRVGSGTIAERAVAFDGYTGVMPKTAATVAEVLKQFTAPGIGRESLCRFPTVRLLGNFNMRLRFRNCGTVSKTISPGDHGEFPHEDLMISDHTAADLRCQLSKSNR